MKGDARNVTSQKNIFLLCFKLLYFQLSLCHRNRKQGYLFQIFLRFCHIHYNNTASFNNSADHSRRGGFTFMLSCGTRVAMKYSIQWQKLIQIKLPLWKIYY